MLPIAENLSVYIVSSFEIRQYSCTPRLHKQKNFLAMGRRFCKKTVLLSGAAPDRGIPMYCERRATMPITAPFLQKSIAPWLYCLSRCQKPRTTAYSHLHQHRALFYQALFCMFSVAVRYYGMRKTKGNTL